MNGNLTVDLYHNVNCLGPFKTIEVESNSCKLTRFNNLQSFVGRGKCSEIRVWNSTTECSTGNRIIWRCNTCTSDILLNDFGDLTGIYIHSNPQSFSEIPQHLSTNSMSLVIAGAVLAALTFLFAIIAVWRKWCRKYPNKLQMLKPSTSPVEQNEGSISIEEILFDPTDMFSQLGSGAYGIVYKGHINGKLVAIKTIEKFAPPNLRTALLNEIRLHQYLGGHENLVKFLGFYASNREILLALEYCEFGNLQQYLQEQSHKLEFSAGFSSNPLAGYQAHPGDIAEMNYGPDKNLQNLPNALLQRMHDWATDVARGMGFLHSKKVIHTDLAARNILISRGFVAKISDFGLSRKLYDKQGYNKTGNDMIPLKSLAMESLLQNTYSFKSDIWSYGITIWEIFSMGKEPYENLSSYEQLVNFLERGERLPNPRYCPEKIYEIIFRCWNADPLSRPDFSDVIQHLVQPKAN